MTLLGTLLRNRRPDERNFAWNQPNLLGPDTLKMRSDDFTDGGALTTRQAGKRVGGANVSPHLAWDWDGDALPGAGSGPGEIVLLVEDLDAPLGSNPPVHCLAIIESAKLATPGVLPAGALDRKNPAAGVTLLRSLIGRGYYGAEPLKGHGPHRYVFQMFVLGESLLGRQDRDALVNARPRRALASIDVPIVARGRITGVHER